VHALEMCWPAARLSIWLVRLADLTPFMLPCAEDMVVADQLVFASVIRCHSGAFIVCVFVLRYYAGNDSLGACLSRSSNSPFFTPVRNALISAGV
jgi:hypothetical protein